jgi:hypothetical protein
MIALINDCLRCLISIAIRCLGASLFLVQRIRIRLFNFNQNRLRRKYRIIADTPILEYGKDLEVLIDAAAAKKSSPVRFPTTSGSTGEPKRILFTVWRLSALKLLFTDFFVRCCWSFSITRTNLYVFSSFNEDDSLTSMLLEEKSLPSYFSTLQAPYRVQQHPSMRALASKYGPTAVRLWIITLSNPGVLYSTNPSTLSTFFDELKDDWQTSSQLVRDWQQRSDIFDSAVRRIARRLSSVGCSERIDRLAACEVAPAIASYASAVSAYICWTGGYVKPFLQRLEKHLPEQRYRLIPMYSMSTETVETIGHVSKRRLHFLPIAPGVLYEFLREEGAVLQKPHELQPGKSYVLVVSDAYGLRRYNTGDVFLCRQKIHGMPDLEFLRRRDLQYSFTGEKLTGAQIMIAFDRLRRTQAFDDDQFLTCIPSHPTREPIPHYKLIVVSNATTRVEMRSREIEVMCDKLFADINCEYKSKRETRRLGPVRLVVMNQTDFINLTRRSSSWETQLKFLPLYVQTWESLNRVNVVNPVPQLLLPNYLNGAMCASGNCSRHAP